MVVDFLEVVKDFIAHLGGMLLRYDKESLKTRRKRSGEGEKEKINRRRRRRKSRREKREDKERNNSVVWFF